jgi:hypothetical protein
VALEDVTTFSIVPVPRLLFQILGDRALPAGVRFEAETMTVLAQWTRFLPEFLQLTIEKIQIINGGLAVRLGYGSADLPTPR